MFGLFSKKTDIEICDEYYQVSIEDVKTVAQLRECVKIIMKCLAHQDTTHFRISKNKINEYPNLAKIATEAGDNKDE